MKFDEEEGVNFVNTSVRKTPHTPVGSFMRCIMKCVVLFMVVSFATYEFVDWLLRKHSVLNFDCGDQEDINYPEIAPSNSNILSSYSLQQIIHFQDESRSEQFSWDLLSLFDYVIISVNEKQISALDINSCNYTAVYKSALVEISKVAHGSYYNHLITIGRSLAGSQAAVITQVVQDPFLKSLASFPVIGKLDEATRMASIIIDPIGHVNDQKIYQVITNSAYEFPQINVDEEDIEEMLRLIVNQILKD